MTTILVVDDRALNRDFIIAFLQPFGYRVIEASDGKEALDRMQLETPNLIISDIQMPVMDGQEFVINLRNIPAFCQIPVIFYTATYRYHEACDIAQRCGVQHILSKPSEPEAILHIVRTLLQEPPIYPYPIAEIKECVSMQMPIELEAINSQFVTLIEIGLDIVKERNPVQLAHLAVGAARNLLGTQYAFLAILSEPIAHTNKDSIESNILLYQAGFRDESLLTNVTLNTLKGSILQFMAEARLLQFSAQDEYLKTCGWPSTLFPIEPVLTLPLLANTHFYGQLCLIGKRSADSFNEQDKRIATILATTITTAYENIRLSTDHKMATESLHNSELQFRQFAENSRDIFWIMLPDGYQLVYVNSAYEDIWGRPIEELYHDNPGAWLNAIHPEDQFFIAEKLLGLKNDKMSDECEFRIIRPDGVMRWIYARCFQLKDEKGLLFRIAGISSDITSRKEAELLAQTHRAHLAAVAHSAVMGEMASTLAHELNQPLTAITTYLHACIRHLESNDFQIDEVLNAMKVTVQQAERAGEIIHQMKNFVRTGNLYFESIGLNSLIQKITQSSEIALNKLTIRWCFELEDTLPEVVIDRLHIEQVLVNLIRNAIDAMQEVNTVNPCITICTKLAFDKTVSVCVTDNGPGIPVELENSIFQPYITSKKQGMGLGLAISRTIVEAHGGRLTAFNPRTGGACFCFSLPSAKAE